MFGGRSKTWKSLPSSDSSSLESSFSLSALSSEDCDHGGEGCTWELCVFKHNELHSERFQKVCDEDLQYAKHMSRQIAYIYISILLTYASCDCFHNTNLCLFSLVLFDSFFLRRYLDTALPHWCGTFDGTCLLCCLDHTAIFDFKRVCQQIANVCQKTKQNT